MPRSLAEHKAYMKSWRANNPEKARAYDKKARAKRKALHAEDIRKYHREYARKFRTRHADRLREQRKRHYLKHSVAILARKKVNLLTLKVATFTHYGGCKCACCDETTLEFLSLDHIHNNGAKHRREGGKSGHVLYGKLRKAGYPDGYQVLCYNCNLAKGFYGVCPHQRKLEVVA